MNTIEVAEFDWVEELHKEVVKSITTTFGLDFLLFDDKKGGDVDTIHNVRQFQGGDKDIHVSERFKSDYENKGDYRPLNENGKRINKYHTDSKYINKGRTDKVFHQKGELKDNYRNKNMTPDEKRQLDHIIAASEVHNDAGRVLAGVDGVDLANTSTNLSSTHSYINNLKSDHTVEHFIEVIIPKTIDKKKTSIANNQEKLKALPRNTPEEQHIARKLEDEIRKDQEHLETIESIDKQGMREADIKARSQYNKEIGFAYYSSSKFLTSTAKASLGSGYKMGLRQSVGIVLAEVWFELKESMPIILDKLKRNFILSVFINEVGVVLKSVFERVSKKFKDILSSFCDGFLSGIFSSITTTILNIFFTTHKLVGRLIRETWNSLVGALKLIFFNPHELTTGQLVKEVIRVLSAGAAAFVGIVINEQLKKFFAFPVGTEIAAFISALVTGIIIIGLTYFLDHSAMMKKVWEFLDRFKSKSKITLEYFQKVNEELDRYLLDLAGLEFNLNPHELEGFSNELSFANSEMKISYLLTNEIKRRDIDLPFEIGNANSTRTWLKSLQRK
ncbi:MAG: ATPase [Gammaproteobacteria bacterium]|nr:ATPase [Gammaproteobacteria bacterium]